MKGRGLTGWPSMRANPQVIDWAQEDRDQLREVARKEWEAYAQKSDLAQEALDAHISYMTEIGLFKE